MAVWLNLSGANLDIISLINKFSDLFFAFSSKKVYLCAMKHLYSIVLVLAFCLFSACHKSIIDDSKESGADAKDATTAISDEIKATALTISEAQQVSNGTSICVKGYIVAATERSIHNADFTSPFQGSSAIVLARKASDGSDNQFDTHELFPICLTDAPKSIREGFNLESNPQYWNQYVFIEGTKENYLSMAGLKKVKGIETDPNHVDNETADVPDDNNEDEGGDSDTGGGDSDSGTPDDEGDNPDIDDGGSQDSSVLTVAEAKMLSSATHDISIQGYIVAATAYDMPSCVFQEPFDETYNNYIVLADKPFDTTQSASEQFDLVNFSDLLPIQLGAKTKKLWKEMNLVQHPQYHNRLLKVTGTIIFQLGTIGMYEVEDYTLIPRSSAPYNNK